MDNMIKVTKIGNNLIFQIDNQENNMNFLYNKEYETALVNKFFMLESVHT